jgi:hypothetical protein
MHDHAPQNASWKDFIIATEDPRRVGNGAIVLSARRRIHVCLDLCNEAGAEIVANRISLGARVYPHPMRSEDLRSSLLHVEGGPPGHGVPAPIARHPAQV